MDPSPIEMLSTLETRSGPGIRDEIYHFKDKKDRDVALRFDFTMGLTRYVSAQQSIRLPAKMAAFGGVFRYDEPQKGRYRYFHQWNLEIYGKKSMEAEAELVEMTSRLFDSLSIKNIVIDISHRNLVESYINKIFDSKDPRLVADILRAVDKVAKKSKKEILQEFQNKGYDAERMEKILEFSQIKGDIQTVERAFDTAQLESWDHLKALFDSLVNRGVLNVRINFGIVRGLDYYSGMVFEVFEKDSALGALAGGGRYDSLTRAFGREDISAVGVAGGVERTILTMQEQGAAQSSLQKRVAVLYVNAEMQKIAHSVTSMLRLDGIPTDIDLAGRSMKKQMEIASDAHFSIIVGPKETQNGEVVLKDMKDGTEKVVSLKEIAENPKKAMGLEKP